MNRLINCPNAYDSDCAIKSSLMWRWLHLFYYQQKWHNFRRLNIIRLTVIIRQHSAYWKKRRTFATLQYVSVLWTNWNHSKKPDSRVTGRFAVIAVLQRTFNCKAYRYCVQLSYIITLTKRKCWQSILIAKLRLSTRLLHVCLCGISLCLWRCYFIHVLWSSFCSLWDACK